MDIDNLIDLGTAFFRDHAIWAISIALAIAILIYWKPKGMSRLALAGLTVGAIIYVVAFLVELTSHGIDETRKFSTTPEVSVD
jgi:hypothetical protein